MISSGAINTNREDTKILCPELRDKQTLLRQAHVFEEHAISNGAQWN